MRRLPQNGPVSNAPRLILPALLLLGLAGCQTTSPPLSNVEIQDGLNIAPASPLQADVQKDRSADGSSSPTTELNARTSRLRSDAALVAALNPAAAYHGMARVAVTENDM